MGERHPKKGYRSLNTGQHQTIDLIEQLSRERNSVVKMCELFEVARSSYHYRIRNKGKENPDRERLKQKVIDIHTESRGSAGSRSITGKLNQDGEEIGRYKTSSIMKEAALKVSNQVKTSIKTRVVSLRWPLTY